jgi:hypothetical protein
MLRARLRNAWRLIPVRGSPEVLIHPRLLRRGRLRDPGQVPERLGLDPLHDLVPQPHGGGHRGLAVHLLHHQHPHPLQQRFQLLNLGQERLTSVEMRLAPAHDPAPHLEEPTYPTFHTTLLSPAPVPGTPVEAPPR